MTITPSLCRAARGLIGLNQSDLAKFAGVGLSTVAAFEAGRSVPQPHNLAAIEAALVERGAMVIADGEASPSGGAGVRLKA